MKYESLNPGNYPFSVVKLGDIAVGKFDATCADLIAENADRLTHDVSGIGELGFWGTLSPAFAAASLARVDELLQGASAGHRRGDPFTALINQVATDRYGRQHRPRGLIGENSNQDPYLGAGAELIGVASDNKLQSLDMADMKKLRATMQLLGGYGTYKLYRFGRDEQFNAVLDLMESGIGAASGFNPLDEGLFALFATAIGVGGLAAADQKIDRISAPMYRIRSAHMQNVAAGLLGKIGSIGRTVRMPADPFKDATRSGRHRQRIEEERTAPFQSFDAAGK